jgi:hypothetical protein
MVVTSNALAPVALVVESEPSEFAVVGRTYELLEPSVSAHPVFPYRSAQLGCAVYPFSMLRQRPREERSLHR